ncbi:uncharacterized protein LY89DRAFT_633492 [Mollisia scopiformis]|uniref:NAD(P)-binding domain-containing protein n=1 Tax=Mollisia scopiformis TaxID=149040 RepID=A0A194XU02_MOLSC|nr:uncharacterized protein LY89DRAFT_633492 [Mollisia scopiformis]KUJ23800.1 hypothetical protein LY89DRAFT_633492 [Mollisia scopiformis]
MKVLLLGVTGNVGSRLLPALLAHNHQVIAYVRSPTKISPEAKSKITSVVVGSASDSEAIKAAILSNNCDAVVNAAGLPATTSFSSQGEFPAIFTAVVKAIVDAGRERGTGPIRCWLMSGFGILDSPKKPHILLDYMPLFPAHRGNYQLIKSYAADDLAWSLFAASQMNPKYDTAQFPPAADTSADNLVARANAPPAWTQKFRWVPLIGNYLNVMVQGQSYFAVLENCVDFIAADLEKGHKSEWIGKRVGVKEKSAIK